MSKKRYDIVLSDANLQSQTLSEACSEMEICDDLPELAGVVSLMLTEDEAEHLRQHSNIVSVEEELQVIEHAFTPRSMTKEMRTKYTPSTSTAGANYASTHFHYHSDQTVTGNTGPIGFFDGSPNFEDWSVSNQVISQNYAGQYVDIVAIEAGTPDAANDGYENHPDFLDDQGNTRFVKMDWSNHGASLTSVYNNQATNNTRIFSDHAIGVMSVAAGLVCGAAKVSSIRVIYLADGITNAYNAVLAWHNSKPVNPATGRRNATITTGAWGYSGIEHTTAWPIESISNLTWYDDEGNEQVTTRPVGGSWNNDFTTFINAGFIPRVINNPHTGNDEWMITSNVQNRATAFTTALQSFVDNGSIYHFKSAGNNATVSAHPEHPRWNTRFTTGPGDGATGDHDYVYIYVNLLTGLYEFTASTHSAGLTWYPYRCYGEGGPTMITVGASQHSTVNPMGDDYSNRGPILDVWSSGAYTWSARPSATYTDGKWGYFSGTSCAAPVAAGHAAVMVDWFFDTYGEYPTHDQLKDLIKRTAKPVMESENKIDWTNVPPAADIASDRLYNTTDLNRIKEGDYQNGGSDVSDLAVGTTNRRIHVPDYILRNTKNYASSISKQNKHYVSIDPDRQSYPRRKIRVG